MYKDKKLTSSLFSLQVRFPNSVLTLLSFYNTFSKKDFLLNIPAEECVTDPLRKVQQHKVSLKNFKPYAKGGLGVSCLEKRSILIHSQSEREKKNCIVSSLQVNTGLGHLSSSK